ncbi:UNVERIFIED_CONTAM: hypothetical protein HDU68_002172, partial [Siphonaria sp. JEL0065]
TQLAFLRRQRLDIDNYSPEIEIIKDPVTNEEIQITKAAKAAILFEIFGEEAVDENIENLLKRHAVSETIQSKLGTTLGQISSVDNDSLLAIGLLGKERRKLLALSNMLKSKVSESLLEQDKVKSSIERKVLALQRENDEVSERLRKITISHTALKKEIEIRSRTVKQNWSGNKQTPGPVLGITPSPKDGNSLEPVWGYFQFDVDKEVAKRIQMLTDDIKKNRHDRGGQTNHDTCMPAVYLASLFIMMKHMSGIDQFLIGVERYFHKNILTIGLVSETVPVKANMNVSGLSFVDLVETIALSLDKLDEVGANASFYDFISKMGKEVAFPLQYSFYDQDQVTMWKEAGLTVDDLLELPGLLRGSKLSGLNGSTDCDAKLTIVEDKQVITGVFIYRKDQLQQETVMRWVQKYQTTLDGLPSTTKKALTVGQLISRYYNSALGK